MSDALQSIIKSITNLFRFHKKKIFAFFVFSLLFFVLLFPYDDLGDLVTSEIYKKSNKQVFLQFETLGWQIFPVPGIKLGDANLILAGSPPIKMESLAISPNIASYLAFNQGANVNITGLFGGNVQASFKLLGEKPEKLPQALSLSIDQLNISHLLKWLDMDYPVKGSLEVDLSSELDLEFKDQPKGEFDIRLANLKISTFTASTPGGPIPIPGIEISNITIEGEIRENSVFLNQVKIGKPGDSIQGKLSGSLGLKMSKRRSKITPRFSNYELNLSLTLSSTLFQKLSLYLSFLPDTYKTKTNNGLKIDIKLTGRNFNSTPNMRALTKKF